MALRVRASFAKEMLEEVEADAARAAILDRLGRDVVDRINAQTPMAWVDARDFELLLLAVVAVGGDDALVAISRRHAVRIRKNPLLRNALDAMVRIFGLSPQMVFKLAPRARGSVVQGGGTLTWEKLSETSCQLLIRGFHPDEFHVALVNARGTWLGVLDLCGVDGDVSIDNADVGRGDVDFVARWST